MRVEVFYDKSVPAYYRKTSKYKNTALKSLGAAARQKGVLNIILVSEREILSVNKQFLKHNYVTDVISFNYPKPLNDDMPFGDIFICFKQGKRQAAQQGHGALKELLILAAHGALHLVGYEDHTKELRDAMNAKAQKIAEEFL